MPNARLSIPDLGVTRTGSRAARIGAFAFEVWSRSIVDRAAQVALRPERSVDQRARELSWVAENVCALHGVRPSVHGELPKQPSLLVANHMSYLDPVVLTSLTPLTAVAKREVADWPWVGSQCRRYGVLYYERDNTFSGAVTLRNMMRAFEQGLSVLVFPEGTTTAGDHVLPFKRGSFGAAILAGVPVVPVALRYDNPSAAWVGEEPFLPHYVRTVSKRYTRVNVDILPALSSQHGSADQLAGQARDAIVRALQSGDARRASHVSRFADVAAVATA